MITSSLEEYLKTIYILKNTEGQIRVTDISKKLNCSKPSVNRALNCLKEEGLILYQAYGDIEITEEGTKTASAIIKRYDILRLFLTEVLGVEEKLAEEEATKMKHSISENTIAKLEKYIVSVLGLEDLNCNFDLARNTCQKCVKIKNAKKYARKEEIK
ncbi:MAG: metal-dependent transcriptional regulator [Clostridia bacterium]|nr:metal-dependent transcriptional regulator [Clostridia bacterium]